MFEIISLIKNVIDGVQQKNREDENVRTADRSVFDNMRKRVDENETKPNETMDRADLYKILREHVEQTKVENEADPEVETADASVFDDMMKEIEALKEKLADQESEEKVYVPQAPEGRTAVTNSFGGSLALRMKPDMSSPINTIRVPDNSMLRVLQYSDHTIHLDGKPTRWAQVDFNGQRGWILENYLNFN